MNVAVLTLGLAGVAFTSDARDRLTGRPDLTQDYSASSTRQSSTEQINDLAPKEPAKASLSAGIVVFIGSVGPQYHLLSERVVNAPLLQAGNIGLYQHANGNSALTPGQRAVLWASWGFSNGGTGRGQTVGEVGGFIPIDPGYVGFFGDSYPAEVNMNVITGVGDGSGSYTSTARDTHPGMSYTGFTSVLDLTTMKAAIMAARHAGATNVAIFMTPNGGGEDLDDPFTTSDYWANARSAALYGDGIALDVPPTYWTLRGPPYQAIVSQMISWANAQAIRSSLVVSPYAAKSDDAGNSAGCGYDPAFAVNTRQLLAFLTAAHALPSQWVVENYGLASAHCGTANDVSANAESNSLNAVALVLSQAMRGPVAPQASGSPTQQGSGRNPS